jgi:hypothetical protein
MSELTLTNGQQLSVACGDGHVVTVRKLDEQRLSIKVERVEGDWPMWQWVKGWLRWLLCLYLSIVITLVLAEVTGNAPAIKSVLADVTTGAAQAPVLKRVWAKMTGVWQQPVLKKALANLSQAFKK